MSKTQVSANGGTERGLYPHDTPPGLDYAQVFDRVRAGAPSSLDYFVHWI